MPLQERIVYLFQRFFAQTCTPEEKEELLHYINKSEHDDQLKELIDETWQQDFPAHVQAAGKADEIFRYITQQQAVQATRVAPLQQGRRISFRRWGRYAAGTAAAILVVVLGFYWLANSGDKTINNSAITAWHAGVGELKTITLPDGSLVKLNANSSLKLSDDFNKKDRHVQLTGEGYFTVSHNAAKPFIIHTKKMDVKVLGTSFNVKAYPDDHTFETSLIRGSVEVTFVTENNRKVILHPNEKVTIANKPEPDTINRQQLPKTIAPMDNNLAAVVPVTINKDDSSITEISWTANKLAFSEESFEAIAKKIERWYDVEVRFDNAAARQYRFTATIEKESLPLVMEALQLSSFVEFRFQVDQNKKIVYIK